MSHCRASMDQVESQKNSMRSNLRGASYFHELCFQEPVQGFRLKIRDKFLYALGKGGGKGTYLETSLQHSFFLTKACPQGKLLQQSLNYSSFTETGGKRNIQLQPPQAFLFHLRKGGKLRNTCKGQSLKARADGKTKTLSQCYRTFTTIPVKGFQVKEWPGSDPVSEAVSRRTERNSGDVNKYIIGNFSLLHLQLQKTVNTA